MKGKIREVMTLVLVSVITELIVKTITWLVHNLPRFITISW